MASMRHGPEAGHLLNVSQVTSLCILSDALTFQNWVLIWTHPQRFHSSVEEQQLLHPQHFKPLPQKDSLMVSA